MSRPKFDYYWREYTGDMPDDPVPGGYDQNLARTYMGQLFVLDQGLLPTRIYKGDKSVTASKTDIYTSSEAIKILCSPQPEKFVWFSTTARTLHVDVIGKHSVVGGIENGRFLNIGRASFQGEVIVGKVCGYNIGSACLYFPYEDQEQCASSYEVLLFDNTAVAGMSKGSICCSAK